MDFSRCSLNGIEFNPLYSDGFSRVHNDTISMGQPIAYFKVSQVEFSKL